MWCGVVQTCRCGVAPVLESVLTGGMMMSAAATLLDSPPIRPGQSAPPPSARLQIPGRLERTEYCFVSGLSLVSLSCHAVMSTPCLLGPDRLMSRWPSGLTV